MSQPLLSLCISGKRRRAQEVIADHTTSRSRITSHGICFPLFFPGFPDTRVRRRERQTHVLPSICITFPALLLFLCLKSLSLTREGSESGDMRMWHQLTTSHEIVESKRRLFIVWAEVLMPGRKPISPCNRSFGSRDQMELQSANPKDEDLILQQVLHLSVCCC